MSVKREPVKKVESLLSDFQVDFPPSRENGLLWLTVPMLVFGLLGMVWAIPFPVLSFLGRYNGYVNWASFLIAAGIYYYYRLSPVLSYGILLFVFASSAAIVSLEKLARLSAWPSMGLVCSVVFVIGIILQFFSLKTEFRIKKLRRLLLYGPLWLMYRMIKKV